MTILPGKEFSLLLFKVLLLVVLFLTKVAVVPNCLLKRKHFNNDFSMTKCLIITR